MFYKLRSKHSELYRIRNGFGLRAIRNDRELKALIDFCKKELRDTEHMKLNPNMADVYSETVRLYESDNIDLFQYIEDHVGWYWS
jgi:hypothetical protein